MTTRTTNYSIAGANQYFREKDYANAIEGYRKAIENGIRRSFIYESMGMAYERMGLHYEAIDCFREALAIDENSQIAKYKLSRNLVNKNDVPHGAPTLSIIVPVYNSSSYLSHCLESILGQSFTNFELIIVNDGSNDSSAKIIESYLQKDHRIRLITNLRGSGNPGTPRNQALDIANGSYVGFVDSDDWIDRDYYKRLIDVADKKSSDIVITSGFKNYVADSFEFREYSGFGRISGYHESFMIWDKVFKRELLERFNIRLGETKAGADIPFILRAYFHASSWAEDVGNFSYNYRRESDCSVTVRYRNSSDCDFEIKAYSAAESMLRKHRVTPEYLDVMAFRKVASYIYTLSVISPAMFDGFFRKAKTELLQIDEEKIKRFVRITRKPHILKKFNDILNLSPEDYLAIYRKSSGKNITNNPAVPTFEIQGRAGGILYFPDWSLRNPYQKLFYGAISEKNGIGIKGFRPDDFSLETIYLNRENYSCIHLHWLHVFIDFSREDGLDRFIKRVRFAKSLGYKIIYTAHNIISHDSVNIDRECSFRKKIIKEFDLILVHGELAKHRLIDELGASEEKVQVIGHGSYADYYPSHLSKSAARARLGLGEDDIVFLFFGNIKGYKGIDTLLSAFINLRREKNGDRAKLVIAGRIFDKEAGEQIEKLCSNEPGIRFYPGFIDEADVQIFFKASDYSVLPYRQILTSGAAILSIAFDVPIIAPRKGLIPDLVENGKTGYLFDDCEGIEKIMCQVLAREPVIFDRENPFADINTSLRWSKLVNVKCINDLFAPYHELISSQHIEKPFKYCLIRIIGNDLPFRHSPDQTIRNLRFMLENEVDFKSCKKIWLINRIVDAEKRKKVINILNDNDATYYEIPFIEDEFKATEYRFDLLPTPDYKLSKAYGQISERDKIQVDVCVLSDKNRYVMNNNGARNRAYEIGKSYARWVLPLDGNCFFTECAWDKLINATETSSEKKYHVIPMQRVTKNEDLLDPNLLVPSTDEEPQIMLRDDADQLFDENKIYGFKPKVDLLKRLGVPGVWDKWTRLFPWQEHKVTYQAGAFGFRWSSWVARLYSGDLDCETNAEKRALNRERGITDMLSCLDKNLLFSDFSKSELTFYDESCLSSIRLTSEKSRNNDPHLQNLLSSARKALKAPLYSVVNKTSLAPSGDPKDYWHPAPYAWPNPDTSDGLPYIHKDGERVPGTRMYEPTSNSYDRTSLQNLFDDVTILALAGYVTSDVTYMEKAYRQIKSWFLDKNSAMNPHLRFSQVIMGKNGNHGTSSGLIETKDFYFFLDAVRLLAKTELWTSDDDEAMKTWCSQFLCWLLTSDQGKGEIHTKNNHGNAFDLQVYSLAAYTGNVEVMYETLLRAISRIPTQFREDGYQVHEMKRTTTAHYTAFNLQLWLNLNEVVRRSCGLNLINMRFNGRHPLEDALAWLIPHMNKPWPYKQIDKFDRNRYQPILYMFKSAGSRLARESSDYVPLLCACESRFHPHDGIAPFWIYNCN